LTGEVVVLPDLIAVARETAGRIAVVARESVAARGSFTIALSGGATPRALFEELAGEDYCEAVDWSATKVLWSDERCVPPDHADSNYRVAYETLLSKVDLPPHQVYRIRGEDEPESAALEYEQIVRREVTSREDLPAFDVILLGMGTDGHTASLFPGTRALREQARLVVANEVPKLDAHRITFTIPLINAALNVMFLVAGTDKAEVLRAVLEGAYHPDVLPSQQVRPLRGRLTWLVDRSAAERLQRK